MKKWREEAFTFVTKKSIKQLINCYGLERILLLLFLLLLT